MPVRLVPNEQPLPGYRLIDRLGRGGFGEVWKCEAPGGMFKAIKFVFGDLESNDEEHSRAAEQELKALDRVKNVRHPYILSLEQYHVVDGQLMIVMELADCNLWDRFRVCKELGMPGIPRDELMKYMDETAEALDLMNNHYHIQHLDIKPQNLFLLHNHVKVADFGLAKTLEGMKVTITGGVTPVYAAPETFEGQVYRYTDQYSLGIVFQELLTGVRPFNGANTKQLLMQHLNGAPNLTPLPPADRPVIDRALAKKPDQRFSTCTDLVKALRAATVVPAAVVATAAQVSADSVSITRAASLLGADTPAGTRTAQPPTPMPGQRPSGPQQLPPRPSGSQNVPPRVPSSGSMLVTPRLVTPQGANGGVQAPANTLTRNNVVVTARMSSLGLAAPERTESGSLMPALVVSVGATGLAALRAFKAVLRERFGSTDAVPHVRCLHIDTDATAGDGPDPLHESEKITARLNRPHHYLNRDGLPSVEGWLPPGLLYNLPRTPEAAAGVRAYGRLALIDNYRTVAQRIRQQVEAFVDDERLDKVAADTGLGVRSNRARVYLLAGLGGGTGSGMLIDLAYILKYEFRQIGYGQPEIHGVLFAPPADKTAPRGPALANTFAALIEYAHFATGRTRYSVKFDVKEPAIADSTPPLARCALYQLPKRLDPQEQAKVAGQAARRMFLELFTPAGRGLDKVRATGAEIGGPPVVSASGLARLTWPRRELLATAGRRLAVRLIQRWTAKETAHLREPIQGWLGEQWDQKGLDVAAVVERFERVLRDTLSEKPDRVFDAFVQPLTQSSARLDAEAAVGVLDQILKLVGKPATENAAPGTLSAPLTAAATTLAKEADTHLSTFAVSLIEKPLYRIAGAEEALAQMDERLTQALAGLAEYRIILDREVKEQFARMFPLIGGLSGGGFASRKTAMANDLADALGQYPRKQLKLLVLDATMNVYRGLQANLPEYLRDVNQCRSRLTAMLADDATLSRPVDAGRYILPDGVDGLDGMADRLLSALSAQDLIGFDEQVQKIVLRKYRGVANVCQKDRHTASFQAMIQSEARAFLDHRLERADPATMFFRYRPPGEATERLVVETLEAAAPDLTTTSGRPPAEVIIVAGPPGPDGDRFRELIQSRLADHARVTPVPLPDDLAIIREYPRLPVVDLPHLGEYAQEAFDAQLRAERSPHSRTDVVW